MRHLTALVQDDDAAPSRRSASGRPVPFLRWLMDNVELEDDSAWTLMEQIVQGANNGTEGIANATARTSTTWSKRQVAMPTTVVDADGDPLMDSLTTNSSGEEELQYPPLQMRRRSPRRPRTRRPETTSGRTGTSRA